MKISTVVSTLVAWGLLVFGIIVSSQAAVIFYLVASGQFQPGEYIYGDLEVPTLSKATINLAICLAILFVGFAGRAAVNREAKKASERT